jgi:hypothetical protein
MEDLTWHTVEYHRRWASISTYGCRLGVSRRFRASISDILSLCLISYRLPISCFLERVYAGC